MDDQTKAASVGSGESDALKRISAQLAELRDLLFERNARAGDLVAAAYIARRTGLSQRTILEGKAGTRKIPRVNLGPRIVRFPKGAVDRFVEEKVREAEAANTRAERFRLLKPKRKRAS